MGNENLQGVQLVLPANVKVPNWLGPQNMVQLDRAVVRGVSLTLVKIIGGDAEFADGWSVTVQRCGSKDRRVAFSSDDVLEIKTANGEQLIARNYQMCTDCLSNTGEMISHRPSKNHGRVDATYRCRQNPTHTWEIQNI